MSQRWRSLSVAMMLLVAPLVGAAPAGGQSEEGNSFRSWNFPNHYIRHRDNLGRIDKVVASDKLGRKDGTFRIVPGLAGQCRSFESVNYPGHFLRHQDYRVKLAPRGERRALPERRDLLRPDGAGELAGEVVRVVQLPGPLHPPHELRALDRPRRRHRAVQEGRHVLHRSGADDARPVRGDRLRHGSPSSSRDRHWLVSARGGSMEGLFRKPSGREEVRHDGGREGRCRVPGAGI